MRSKNVARYFYIDILKFICAFLVICIHAPFSGVIGQYITAIARCAVPIFFMISGYFNSSKVSKANYKKQIKKILILLIYANIIYFIFDLGKAILNNSTEKFILETINLKSFFKFVFLNESPLSAHLWYLSAILYVIIIAYIVERKNLKKYIYAIIPILLLIDLIFGKYSILIFGREFSYVLVRNFIFVGIPYYYIGNFISENQAKIIERIKANKLIIYIILFTFTTIIEHYVLIKLDCNATRDHYISTSLLAISLFLYFLKNDTIKHRYSNIFIKKILKKIQLIGQKHSLNIYVYHPIILAFIYHITISDLTPIITLFVSIIFSIVLKKINNEILYLKEKYK